MRLSAVTHGRDNNLNLLRFVAASAVLVSHCYPLATGDPDSEPLRSLGMSPGTIAVDAFFVISGFLVTGSLLKKADVVAFIRARVLRILPGLAAMLLLCVFLLGPLLTSLSAGEYFAHWQVYKYFLRTTMLLAGVEQALPGLFEANPYASAVNGSLWTMPYEVRMYALLGIMWLSVSLSKRAGTLFKVLVFASAVGGGAWALSSDFVPFRLFFMFFTGASFYLLRHMILLNWSLFLLCCVGLLAGVWTSAALFKTLYVVTAPYVVMFLSYAPGGLIRKYNRVGDYSYGIYVYAFPVQQAVAQLVPQVSVAGMLMISGPLTLLLAALSWHLIEHPSLTSRFAASSSSHRSLAMSHAPARSESPRGS